jgi:hypothetical protein
VCGGDPEEVEAVVLSMSQLEEQASPEARKLARAVLEQDVADRHWSEQVGPALAQRDVARLLGKSEQAVAKDGRLVRVRNRDGRPVYPVFQFAGRSVVPGVAEITPVLVRAVVDPFTVAAWWTGEHPALGGRRPLDALADGDVADVAAAAERFAARARV